MPEMGYVGEFVFIENHRYTKLNIICHPIQVAIPVAVDHADDSQVFKLFDRIRSEQNGRLDILVNNVYSGLDAIATNSEEGKKFWELGSDESPATFWDAVNRVGLRNHYICSVLATRMMLDYRDELNENIQGNLKYSQHSVTKRPGLIFNISSLGGLRYMFAVPYGVGKPCLFQYLCLLID